MSRINKIGKLIFVYFRCFRFIPTFILYGFAVVHFLLLPFILFPQNPKPPEAVDDYAETISGGRVSITVLENDFCEEGHEIEVLFTNGSLYSNTEHTDSTVIYIPIFQFNSIYPDNDVITYRIRDIENGLVSETASIYITIHEIDFNKAKDSLYLNNYNTTFNAYGNYFFDYLGNWRSNFKIPRESRNFTIIRSNLLIGGKAGYYHYLAGEAFLLPYSTDFWPGPYSVSSDYSIQEDSTWNNIWKLNRSEINWHQLHYQDPGYVPVNAIYEWPGNGNTIKGYAEQLAPFTDRNSNGIYEPYLGDTPLIKGNEAVFSIYNDHRTIGMSTASKPLGIEVQQLSYVFDCPDDSTFYNSFFIHYIIINRSANLYTDLFCGMKTIFSIGNEGDDYFGCDTILNCYFGYNDSIDEYFGYTPAYGHYPPAQAICFLNHRMYAFIESADFWGLNGPGPFYNSLKGLWAWGEPMTYGGNGLGGTDTTTYLFPGNPVDSTQWSDFQTNPNSPGVRSGTGSVGPFILAPGDSIEIDIAYVFARDYGGTNLTSVALLKERVERIKWYYENDSTPCGTTWSGNEVHYTQNQHIKIYPNPVSDNLFVQSSGLGFDNSYKIYNLVGQVVQEGVIGNQNVQIHVGHLISGYYIIKISNAKIVIAEKFMKY
ncbi:MAG: T9SS type A sorting domain-containing protein [Bacteroidales bacterium]|nr:T9SS type A sorting domain-containing protein [Bacteroidales bacterium]